MGDKVIVRLADTYYEMTHQAVKKILESLPEQRCNMVISYGRKVFSINIGTGDYMLHLTLQEDGKVKNSEIDDWEYYASETKPKAWHCAKCGKKMQFVDGMCMECFGGDPGD